MDPSRYTMAFFKANRDLEEELAPYHRVRRRYVIGCDGRGYWLEVTQSELSLDPMNNEFDIDVDY